MATLSDSAREKLQGKNFAYIATVMDDGSPHVSPVWVDVEGDEVLVNTAAGRVKARNVERDPRVALSVSTAGDPYDHVDIRGRVTEIVDGGEAEEHIHSLQRKYHGGGSYPLKPGERRLLLRIEPLVVAA